MPAQELAVLFVTDDLDEALAVAVNGAGTDRAVWDFADRDVIPLRAGLFFGEAEARDVRGAERRAGDVDVADRMGR